MNFAKCSLIFWNVSIRQHGKFFPQSPWRRDFRGTKIMVVPFAKQSTRCAFCAKSWNTNVKVLFVFGLRYSIYGDAGIFHQFSFLSYDRTKKIIEFSQFYSAIGNLFQNKEFISVVAKTKKSDNRNK